MQACCRWRASQTERTSVLPGSGLDLEPVRKGSDPLEATRFQGVFVVAGEGQTPFRTGSKHK